MFLLAAACGCRSGRPGRLHARLVLQPHDTVEFAAEARIRRCSGERGFMIEGVDGGNGVLLWLRSTDSPAAGEYSVLSRGDTIAPRGVVGVVRFLIQNTDRGATLDSGVVTVSQSSRLLDAHASGSGLDPRAGQRVVIEASFQGVPLLMADTVSCQVQL
jgi:hypothetical protein